MSIQTLVDDLTLNLAELQRVERTPEAIISHLENTLYPFLSAFLEDVKEIDGVVEELAAGGDDALTPFTAQVIKNAIDALAASIALILKKVPPLAKDPEVAQSCAAATQMGKQAQALIDGITLPEDEEDEEDGDKASDDEEGDEDDDDSK